MNGRGKRVVLVGAGHAHLHIARHAAAITESGAELLLIDSGMFWYSGMATGVLGGMYSPGFDQLDPAQLIESQGGQFLKAQVTGIDRNSGQLLLEDGSTVPYDLLSFNVGSTVPLDTIPGASEHVRSVKPISNLARLRSHLEQAFTAEASTPHVVVLGGGATGCEVAANLCSLAHRNRRALRITLISRSKRLMDRAPKGASRALQRTLAGHGIRVLLGSPVERVESNRVIVAGGSIPSDEIVGAIGLRASPLVRQLRLASDEAGLKTDECLRSVDDARIFGAGDCISFCGRDLPKLGVFGVRQAPVLLHNLRASLRGERLQAYTPQKRYLAILNLGDNDALATWGRLWWRGRSVLWLKDRIDKGFLKGYRRLYQ